jgi:hypothetical protein
MPLVRTEEYKYVKTAPRSYSKNVVDAKRKKVEKNNYQSSYLAQGREVHMQLTDNFFLHTILSEY